MGISTDTIFALSSAPGRAGVSVFRISGSKAFTVAKSVTGRALPKIRMASLRHIVRGGEIIDEVLLICMKGPQSFTGEDTVEIQGHGSLAIIEALSSLLLQNGARQAEAGEFTRRAVLNGRMDLTEAEGLADLIDSETEGQRRQAMRQMQGGLRATYENWRKDLIEALAFIEGEIDFPDEGDVPEALSKKAGPPLQRAYKNMRSALENAGRGERVRSGLNIAVIGPPNAGKSSLINRLAGRDAAIVSSMAGTTRDIIDVQMTIGGLPVCLSDTAGLRASDDEIESEGVRRALSRAKAADIRLFVHDSTLGAWSLNRETEADLITPTFGDALLINKIDACDVSHDFYCESEIKTFKVSAKDGRGIEALQNWLSDEIISKFGLGNVPGLTRARHTHCVKTALESLERAEASLNIAAELAGEDIRRALKSISELAGETDMEAVFDQIFLRFCIGK